MMGRQHELSCPVQVSLCCSHQNSFRSKAAIHHIALRSGTLRRPHATYSPSALAILNVWPGYSEIREVYTAAACVPDARRQFNQMRKFGRAISLALIDTFIYGRSTMHGPEIVVRLEVGHIATAKFVGVPDVGNVQIASPAVQD